MMHDGPGTLEVVIPEDVIDMARPVLSHRMALNFAARARGDSLTDLIESTALSLSGAKAAA